MERSGSINNPITRLALVPSRLLFSQTQKFSVQTTQAAPPSSVLHHWRHLNHRCPHINFLRHPPHTAVREAHMNKPESGRSIPRSSFVPLISNLSTFTVASNKISNLSFTKVRLNPSHSIWTFVGSKHLARDIQKAWLCGCVIKLLF